MQRIWESRWRLLELCWWPDLPELPAKGREYPGLGYQQQLHATFSSANAKLLLCILLLPSLLRLPLVRSDAVR
ncbi:hypothetical protein HaLaN_17560, partial [Haematococcus lacustris]